MESIDVGTLNQWLLNSHECQLLDVRESWEFSHCSIEGSIHIPMLEISNRLHELDSAKDIVVICHHGGRSLQVAYFLEDSALNSKILNLEGGINAWAEQIDPQMPRY